MNNRTVTYNLGINISISHIGSGRQIQLLNVLIYAQFIYVSFVMVRKLASQTFSYFGDKNLFFRLKDRFYGLFVV